MSCGSPRNWRSIATARRGNCKPRAPNNLASFFDRILEIRRQIVQRLLSSTWPVNLQNFYSRMAPKPKVQTQVIL